MKHRQILDTLKAQGFEIYHQTIDAVYVRKGPDHRVVMMKDGSMRRGQPEHRKK